ncbi:MAG: zinc-ribbon domain-containing protein [Thaumarchaeota archaeon]|nr:zinc-ribbon domain-containing protein [Nitrososphaerota archaeon]
MSGGQGITQELGLGEVVSKTFELYRRDFSKYAVLFVVVEAIIGVLTTLVRRAVILPAALPSTATTQQLVNWLPGFFGALITLIALSAIVTWGFYPISVGSAVKLASEEIVTGQAGLVPSVRFAISRIVWIWAVGIVVGIVVILGLVALVVPGIILAIMYSLVLPVVMLERAGFESLGRSRKLVSRRWLKTFALVIVLGIIVGIASGVVSAISGPFGVASTIVSNILSAFYLPIIPIALTVYYYSNAARIAPPMSETLMAPGDRLQVGMKFCPNCGTQIASSTMFCTACGAKQPI